MSNTETTSTRTAFYAVIQFEESVTTDTMLAATDVDHAKKLIQEIHGHRSNFTILDIYPLKEAPNPVVPSLEETFRMTEEAKAKNKSKLN